MKSNEKAKLILLVLGIMLVITTINTNNKIAEQRYTGNNGGSMEIGDEMKVKSPRTSKFWNNFTFIHIDGNWSTAAGYEWCSGEGSFSNPYIIENITMDASSSPTGSGIFINNSKNDYFIIRNCTVYNAGAGIKMKETNNGFLINNNCSKNVGGIRLYNNCNNNKISGNTANNNPYGISLDTNCDDNIISGNTANNFSGWGIYLENDCDNNIISGNTANNKTYGISLLFNSDNNVISGNIANDNGIGVYLYTDCDNNVISGNNIDKNNFYGMWLYIDCDNNTISGNSVNLNTYSGILLYSNCHNNTISGNTANDNKDQGIGVCDESNSNTISNNVVSNDITANQESGIRLFDSDNNIISGNIIKDNQNYGINIDGTDCQNNLIYQNSLNGTNGWHARDAGTNNHWNNSIIGNYWDNHTSPDSDNDGIVDDPYIWIADSANSEDSFPLAENPVHLGEKIHIDDSGVSAWNWSKTAKLKAWCSGSGTYSDPYVIDGLEIDGGGSGSGILIGNSSVYFTIQNSKVYNTGINLNNGGIKLVNTKNGTIINNNCSDNGFDGILLLNDCNNNTISRNTTNNNTQIGIALVANSDNNTIVGNTVNDNNEGIYLVSDCDNNTISGNTANNNSGDGIVLNNYCDNNTISGNTLNDNGWEGIVLVNECKKNTISGNTANNNDDSGIYLKEDCDNNTISRNDIRNNYQGIYLKEDCDNNTISRNDIRNNYQGIQLNFNCDNNKISRNFVIDSLHGIHLYFNCDNNTISENGVYLCDYGIYIEDECDDNIISENLADDNFYYGIYLENNCDNNTILGNTAKYNLDYGINLENNCDNNNITENYVYFNIDGAINITNPNCDANIIKRNILVSEDGKFISDAGTGTIIGMNYYLTTAPSLNVDIIDQSFSITEFIVTINITSGLGFDILFLRFYKMWWNGIEVPSNNIVELGNGLYNISLAPIFVNPGEDPILLNMTIRSANHEEKYYEFYIAVEIYEICVNIVEQIYSEDWFNFTFYIYNASNSNQGIEWSEITSWSMWWNGTEVSGDIIPIGGGLYKISLSPITVAPNEAPILLNMTISAVGYEVKYYETYIAVEEQVEVYEICVNIIEQIYSEDWFNFTFYIYNASNSNQGIEWSEITNWFMWWNGIEVSADIVPIGGGVYKISLIPITVAPNEAPILLNMTISAVGYEDKYFEFYIAVDPELIDKSQPSPPPKNGDGGNGNGAKPPDDPIIPLIILGISIAAGCVVVITAWKKQLFTKLKRK